MFWQWPASASSTLLSMTSWARWFGVRVSVYIPGRRRTGSRPLRTSMSEAVYDCAIARECTFARVERRRDCSRQRAAKKEARKPDVSRLCVSVCFRLIPRQVGGQRITLGGRQRIARVPVFGMIHAERNRRAAQHRGAHGGIELEAQEMHRGGLLLVLALQVLVGDREHARVLPDLHPAAILHAFQPC